MNSKKNTHKFKTRYTIRFIHVVVFALMITVLLLQSRNVFWDGTDSGLYDGTCNYRESEWIYRKGSEILDPDFHVPGFRKMEKGETYSISSTLTYDASGDQSPSCFFFIDHMFCKVKLDGETVFSYMPEDIRKHDRSKSPGNIYVSAPLPSDCLGKELTIEFVPSLDADIEYQIPLAVFGDHATSLSYLFWADLPHNLILVFSMILGLGAILYSTLEVSKKSYLENIYIGIFAILFGLYNVTESDFDFYMISNPYFTYILDYVTFSLIPLFFAAFLREHLDAGQKKISTFLILFCIVTYGIEFFLHFAGIMDMREFLPITHFTHFANMITHIFLVWNTRNKVWRKRLVVQLIPILLGMCIDMMVYYLHIDLDSSDSTFSSLGVMIFLTAELYHSWISSMEVYAESVKSRFYQQMALVDSLTNIGNHRAYELEKEAVISGRKTYETLTIVSADLNDLKIANDTLGHSAGDFLISHAAKVLVDFVGAYGHVFRTGGDEFIAFFYDISPDELDHRLLKLYEHIAEINKTSPAKLDLAIGMQLCDEDIDYSIQEADRKMYVNKARYKALKAGSKNLNA